MKKFMAILGIIVALGIIGSFMEDEETAKPAKEEPKQEVKEKEPVKEKPAPAPEPKEEEPEVTTGDIMSPELMLEILQQSYATTAEVTYDETNKAFKIMPVNPDFIKAIALMESGQMAKTEWDTLMDSMQDMSGSLSTGYAVYLMNPANADKVLAVFMDGVKIYDAINDERPFEGL